MLDSELRRTAYEPRPLQLAVHENLRRFNVLVCHRRFGKTVLAVNQLIESATQNNKPAQRYAYIAPLLKQAKSVAWDFLLHYSRHCAQSVNIAELRVDLIGGSRITLYGADNPDALRGLYLDGVVLDEYADMAPSVWTQIIRPALADRKGWAVFIGTPKGRNAFFDLYEAAQSDKEWYAAMFKASETGVIDKAELEAAARSMSAEEYAQEFECSFQAPNIGAYYGKELTQAENDKRITRVPWEASIPVTTAWDLGIDDATAIWFCQQVGREIRVIDYYENSGEGLAHYAKVLDSKPYKYFEHLLPHDAAVKELGSGMSRTETLEGLGVRRTRVLPMQRVEDGINAVRMFLPKCYFDAEKCARGVKALREYQREWNDKLGTWRASPRHDWSSHAADAFRYLAEGFSPAHKETKLDYSRFNKGIV